MSAVSYIDEAKAFRTFRLPLIQVHGCSSDLYSRLRYAKTMCEKLIGKLDSKVGTPPTLVSIPQAPPMAPVAATMQA